MYNSGRALLIAPAVLTLQRERKDPHKIGDPVPAVTWNGGLSMLRGNVVRSATFGIVSLFSVVSAAFAQSPASLDKATIVVWKVGSPFSNETPDSKVPPDLELKAEQMGMRLQIKSFPAKGFAQAFFAAFAQDEEPDVVATDNMLNIEKRPSGNDGVVGIATDPEVRKSLVYVKGSLNDLMGHTEGFEFLVSTSKNHEAARRFAFRPPECDERISSPRTIPADVDRISDQIAKAYLSDPDSARDYDDEDRLVAQGKQWEPLEIRETARCGYWGNEHLAFVSLMSTYESEKTQGRIPVASSFEKTVSSLGQVPVLLVLRKHGTQWRLLAASTDPITNSAFVKAVATGLSLLQDSINQGAELTPPLLLAPQDRQFPEDGDDFRWQPSPSGNIVAEIAEFAYRSDARLFLKLRHSAGAANDRVSAGEIWSAGTEWKWRVWSITDTGAIVFSDVRSFRQ
jgi:hypothetical protein